MAIKDKSVREHQVASYRDAVAKRYATLKEKGREHSAIEKDALLRHLKAELSRCQKRLLAATPKPKPEKAPVKEEPPKTEEPPKAEASPKKKQKTKKAAE